jgi:hypothetical protein
MWQSNGPIFSPQAFKVATARFLETSALCFLMVKLGRPKFILPAKAMEIWTSTTIRPSKIAVLAYKNLY